MRTEGSADRWTTLAWRGTTPAKAAALVVCLAAVALAEGTSEEVTAMSDDELRGAWVVLCSGFTAFGPFRSDAADAPKRQQIRAELIRRGLMNP